MARLYIGTGLSGGGVVKIMANNADDPLTTDNDDWAKFIFNSENQQLAYLADMEVWQYDSDLWPHGGNESTNYYFYPPGSNLATAKAIIRSYRFSSVARQQDFYLLSNYYGITWEHLVEVRVRGDDGRFFGGDTEFRVADVYDFSSYSYFRTTDPAQLKVAVERTVGSSTALMAHLGTATLATSGRQFISALWDLPVEDMSLPVDGTPTLGQRNVLMNESVVKISRPGYDIDTATSSQMVVDSTSRKNPAKILTWGEQFVSAGGNVFVPVTHPLAEISEGLYLDFMVRRSGQNQHVPPFYMTDAFSDDEFRFTWDVESGGMRFYNAGDLNIIVTYIAIAYDTQPVTTGGSKVFYRGNDGTQDFVQVKRPGSSDISPSLKDILLDTRIPTLKIVSEGYLTHDGTTWTTNPSGSLRELGERRHTVNFDNDGSFTPFLKYFVKEQSGAWRAPYSKCHVLLGPWAEVNYTGRQSNGSTIAVLSNDSVTFHQSRDNPEGFQIDGTFGDELTTIWDNGRRPEGIRFYVFALPNP